MAGQHGDHALHLCLVCPPLFTLVCMAEIALHLCPFFRTCVYTNSLLNPGQVGVTSGYVPTLSGSAVFFVGTPASYHHGLAGCQDCTAGHYSWPYAHHCSPCQAGTSASNNGTAVCSDCQAGGFSYEGAFSCTGCTAGKSSTAIGAGTELECIKCDAGKSSSPGSTSCVVSCDFLEVLVDSKCEPCAVGAVCDSDGMRVETMAISPTYWRTSNSSNNILKCTNEAACTSPTNSTSLCAAGHGGPFCELCVDTYALSAGSCASCESGGASLFAVTVLAVLAVSAVGWCILAIKDSDEAQDARSYFNKMKKRYRVSVRIMVHYFQVSEAPIV